MSVVSEAGEALKSILAAGGEVRWKDGRPRVWVPSSHIELHKRHRDAMGRVTRSLQEAVTSTVTEADNQNYRT